MTIEVPGFDGLRAIGSGGCSKVYQATDLHHGRQVAIKVLTIDSRPGFDRSAFARECTAQGAVSDHPHIVTLLGSGTSGSNQAYIVMELYRHTLLGRIKGQHQPPRPLPVAEVLDLGIKIGTALQYSHATGLVHGDIKPQNILFSKSANEPALGDFGIAAWMGSQNDAAPGFTRAYAAPEVVAHAVPSDASDLYSLGATLYAALAGIRPFRRHRHELSHHAMEQRILNEPAPPITAQEVPPQVTALIDAMMAKLAADRPTSAADVVTHLNELLDAERDRRTGRHRVPMTASPTHPAAPPATTMTKQPGRTRPGVDGEGTVVRRPTQVAVANAHGTIEAGRAFPMLDPRPASPTIPATAPSTPTSTPAPTLTPAAASALAPAPTPGRLGLTAFALVSAMAGLAAIGWFAAESITEPPTVVAGPSTPPTSLAAHLLEGTTPRAEPEPAADPVPVVIGESQRSAVDRLAGASFFVVEKFAETANSSQAPCSPNVRWLAPN